MQINLDDLKKRIHNKKVLFVTNRNSFLKNKFDEVLASVGQTTYNDFEINPKLSDVKNACEKLNGQKFDYIVGVGGGTPMDFAKLLHYFLERKLKSETEYLKLINFPVDQKINSKLVLIPTTSGSGSEATHFSVVYHQMKKYSFAHESLRANFIVLDPIFTQNLPPKVTAYTGMDAICHAIESYWAKGATIESREFALNALKLLVPHIKDAVHRPTNLNRMAMLEGAYLAGKAIDISKTTAAHALSYYLTTHYNIPHGQAVALMLTYFLDAHGDFPEINQIFKTDQLQDAFTKLLVEIDLYIDIKESITNFDDFIDSVNIQRLKNNPVEFSKEELKRLLSN